MDRQKTALVDALARLGSAQCRLYKAESDSESTKPTLEEIDNTYLELLKFSDSVDKVTGQFIVWHACVHGHYGRMIKTLLKLNEDKPTKEQEEAIVWAMNQLGWQHSVDLLSSTAPARFPPSYRLF